MSQRQIGEIVRHQQLIVASPETTVRNACRAMTTARVGAVMILEKGLLTGIFTERDALNRVLTANLDPDTTPLSQVMTREPTSVGPEKPLSYALHLMHIGGYRHMPVCLNGKPLGIVSVRDALGEELINFERELKEIDQLTELL